MLTSKPQPHIHHFSTPHTGIPQKQNDVSTEICHLFPPPVESSELDSASWSADMAEIHTAGAQMKGCTHS